MKDDEIATLGEIGRRIRSTRKAGHLNLQDLARLSGVSAPALSLIETGKRDLRITTLHRIAKALRVQAGALLSESSAATQDPLDPGVMGYDLTDYT